MLNLPLHNNHSQIYSEVSIASSCFSLDAKQNITGADVFLMSIIDIELVAALRMWQ